MSALNSLDSGKVVTKGGLKSARVSEPEVVQLLREAVTQLKILNTYMSLGHDEVIKEEDINEN